MHHFVCEAKWCGMVRFALERLGWTYFPSVSSEDSFSGGRETPFVLIYGATHVWTDSTVSCFPRAQWRPVMLVLLVVYWLWPEQCTAFRLKATQWLLSTPEEAELLIAWETSAVTNIRHLME